MLTPGAVLVTTEVAWPKEGIMTKEGIISRNTWLQILTDLRVLQAFKIYQYLIGFSHLQ